MMDARSQKSIKSLEKLTSSNLSNRAQLAKKGSDMIDKLGRSTIKVSGLNISLLDLVVQGGDSKPQMFTSKESSKQSKQTAEAQTSGGLGFGRENRHIVLDWVIGDSSKMPKSVMAQPVKTRIYTSSYVSAAGNPSKSPAYTRMETGIGTRQGRLLTLGISLPEVQKRVLLY